MTLLLEVTLGIPDNSLKRKNRVYDVENVYLSEVIPLRLSEKRYLLANHDIQHSNCTQATTHGSSLNSWREAD